MDMDEICELDLFLSLWLQSWSAIHCIYYQDIMWYMVYLYLFLKDDNYGAEEVENLKSLVSNLRQLLDLHQKYNCRLSLSVFEKVCLLLVTCSTYIWSSNKVLEKSFKSNKILNHRGAEVMLILSCRCQWRSGEIAFFHRYHVLLYTALFCTVFDIIMKIGTNTWTQRMSTVWCCFSG